MIQPILKSTNHLIPVEADAVSAVPDKTYLLSKHADWLMIGGASVLMFGLFWFFVDKKASVTQISWAAFYLAMLVNHPHFMASYFLLYWDKRKELLNKKSYLWAGVVAPAALIGYLAVALNQTDTRLLGYAVNFMYFIVGWHYVKQIYGTSIVSAGKSGFYMTRGESWTLRLNMYPVWFMSWLNGNGALRTLNHYGVNYDTIVLPEFSQRLNFTLVGLSALVLIGMIIRKYVREGKVPPLASVAAVAAIYVWYIPSFYHPHFFYMIPFFHSLQYMLFVIALKRNEFRQSSFAAGREPQEARRLLVKKSLGYAALLGFSGMLFFIWGPKLLDQHFAYNEAVFGPQIFMFLFLTFINIHHYFIDNVIWKRDNPSIRQYLSSSPTAARVG